MPLSLDSFLFEMQADKLRKYVKESMLVYVPAKSRIEKKSHKMDSNRRRSKTMNPNEKEGDLWPLGFDVSTLIFLFAKQMKSK